MTCSARKVAAICTKLALASGFGLGGMPAFAQSDAMPFVADAKAGYMFRTSYFDRRSDGDAVSPGFTQQGMGVGGWLWGKAAGCGAIPARSTT